MIEIWKLIVFNFAHSRVFWISNFMSFSLDWMEKRRGRFSLLFFIAVGSEEIYYFVTNVYNIFFPTCYFLLVFTFLMLFWFQKVPKMNKNWYKSSSKFFWIFLKYLEPLRMNIECFLYVHNFLKKTTKNMILFDCVLNFLFEELLYFFSSYAIVNFF